MVDALALFFRTHLDLAPPAAMLQQALHAWRDCDLGCLDQPLGSLIRKRLARRLPRVDLDEAEISIGGTTALIIEVSLWCGAADPGNPDELANADPDVTDALEELELFRVRPSVSRDIEVLSGLQGSGAVFKFTATWRVPAETVRTALAPTVLGRQPGLAQRRLDLAAQALGLGGGLAGERLVDPQPDLAQVALRQAVELRRAAARGRRRHGPAQVQAAGPGLRRVLADAVDQRLGGPRIEQRVGRLIRLRQDLRQPLRRGRRGGLRQEGAAPPEAAEERAEERGAGEDAEGPEVARPGEGRDPRPQQQGLVARRARVGERPGADGPWQLDAVSGRGVGAYA